MKLVSLTISNHSYEKQPKVEATFEGGFENRISLRLDPGLGAKIVSLCADEILSEVKKSAEQFTRDALKSVALIEQQPYDEEASS